MTAFDSHDDEANLAAAQASVLAEHAEHRTGVFLAKRPNRFAAPGELHPDVLAWCQRLYRGHPGALILMGGVGTGKTWSVWKAGETLTRHGWRGRYEVADAYEIKDALRDRDKDAERLWRGADVLAVDDIGAIGMHDWDSDNMHKLINERWKHEKPTVLTTNTTNLKPVLGERVASRLAHEATFVALGGADRRRNQ